MVWVQCNAVGSKDVRKSDTSANVYPDNESNQQVRSRSCWPSLWKKLKSDHESTPGLSKRWIMLCAFWFFIALSPFTNSLYDEVVYKTIDIVNGTQTVTIKVPRWRMVIPFLLLSTAIGITLIGHLVAKCCKPTLWQSLWWFVLQMAMNTLKFGSSSYITSHTSDWTWEWFILLTMYLFLYIATILDCACAYHHYKGENSKGIRISILMILPTLSWHALLLMI